MVVGVSSTGELECCASGIEDSLGHSLAPNWGLKIFDLSCYCLGTPQGGFDHKHFVFGSGAINPIFLVP